MVIFGGDDDDDVDIILVSWFSSAGDGFISQKGRRYFGRVELHNFTLFILPILCRQGVELEVRLAPGS